MSTFAISVGAWDCHDLTDTCSVYSAQGLLSDEQIFVLGEQLEAIDEQAEQLLGKYPFPRKDLLILPRNFDSLGLASPNVIFLSQSVIRDAEGTMCGIRLAHEVAHGWFGLLIGAKDWTEEWLSEGFATYVEDLIFCRTTNWNLNYIKNWREIRTLLRYKLLLSELEEIPEHLQTLRPNQGEIVTNVVKNGLNSDKGFMQVHYLKGYFLLSYLSSLVGEESFLKVLKQYVEEYKGQLVSSEEILKIYLSNFPYLENEYGIDLKSLSAEWLDTNYLPKMLKEYNVSADNDLYAEVTIHLKWWKQFNSLKRKKLRKSSDKSSIISNKFCCEQKTLLLELLLQEKRLTRATLSKLKSVYKLDECDAEVRHRWCELLIKHDDTRHMADVKQYLYEDQGMGVYLYGELMLSERPHLQKLARECWARVQQLATRSAAKLIKEMLAIT